MTTISGLLEAARQQLEPVSESARLDAELMLADVLGKNRTYLYTWNDKTVAEEQVGRFTGLLNRRMDGEPIAYILGHQEFWSLNLKTAPDTLIPRPDTETLVEWATELLSDEPAHVIDLGTGTGAIALALASEKKQWKVEGVDLIENAVNLARENAVLNNLERVSFYQSSWFSSVKGKFSLIVSNPPYIDPEDRHLSEGDVRFEPKSALVAEDSGLADLRHIIQSSRDYLEGKGWLLVEHGYDQMEAVQAMFRDAGYINTETRYDLGGNPRITGGQWCE